MANLFFMTVVALTASQTLTIGDVELVADGFLFTEGPVWVNASGTLLFSDIPADTIYAMDKTLFRKPSGQSNGLTLDHEGRLIACEHKNRRVSRTEKNGNITVLAEKYQGKRLNSPNDLTLRSDGIIFFTDPPYGLTKGLQSPEAELTFSGVYRIGTDGSITLLIDDFIKPNGIALSPDEKILYIADTEGKHLRAFDVDTTGDISNSRIFCELDSPDGIKVDVEGNIWSTASDGMHVYNPKGELIQMIVCPQQPANCAFGDKDGHTLYVTARTSLYKIRTTVEGILPKPPQK